MTRRNPFPVLAALTGAALCIPVLSAAQSTAQEPAKPPTSVPETYLAEQPVRAAHGMVVSVHHLASDAGLDILRAGGNAVDAAVATGFALAVVHPAAGNLGGGGFLLLRTHDGRSTFIDYREKAPQAATETMYQDAKGNLIPPESLDSSILGYRSIATPGSVAGMVYAERKYGKLGLARVMAPAIQLAQEGFVLTGEEAHELTDPYLSKFPESKRIFQRDGNLYKEGEVFKQPELARTLNRIAADPADFYHGTLAHELVDELHKGGALLTLGDLAKYTVVERTPVTGTFHNYTVISAPPPSSGGIVLLSALNILEGYDLAKLGDRSPASIHLITEACRRAYMDRSDYLGDPDYNPIPVAELTSKKYAEAWRAGIDPNAATPSASLVRPGAFLPPAPNTPGQRHHESDQTTHYSVVDSEGNAVSVTTTLNNSFGSHVTAGSLGFLLNDEMDDFTAKAGVPNGFGLVQGPANAIAPGKRPLSSMTPTIVSEPAHKNKPGRLRLVLGTPGGSTIITTVANDLISVVDNGLDIQSAADAPRFHHQYLPDVLEFEKLFPVNTVNAMQAAGYITRRAGETDGNDAGTWGDSELIAVDPATGLLSGGQDQRHHFGKVSGY